jgi:predicted 2-oxoglutarate/Fe(II)-dependent dioxygenase YbiX
MTNVTTTSWSSRFLTFLNNIEPLGSFASCGTVRCVPLAFPQVTVSGLDGPLSLPLTDIEPLKAVATRAPFGRGEATLYDESVRKAWQVDASMVTVGDGVIWENMLKEVVRQACLELGITTTGANTTRKVHANLYKLLLYEEGGHFTPHRDAEKEDGMFGTLVIQLPSMFSGGDFTVQRGEESKTFKQSINSGNAIKYIAFYADCVHQLHPVTSGARLCLVYNLVESSGSLSHANNLAINSQLQAFVQEWKADRYFSDRLGYHLHHKYTPRSFDVDALKGRDNLAFQTLQAARAANGSPLFQIHLLMMQRYVCYFDDNDEEARMDQDSVTALKVLDSTGVEKEKEELRSFEMYKHTDGWLVSPTYFYRFHHQGPYDRNYYGADSDDWSIFFGHSETDMPSKQIHSMFCGAAREEKEFDTGNEGTAQALWYYAAAIVLSPSDQN